MAFRGFFLIYFISSADLIKSYSKYLNNYPTVTEALIKKSLHDFVRREYE